MLTRCPLQTSIRKSDCRCTGLSKNPGPLANKRKIFCRHIYIYRTKCSKPRVSAAFDYNLGLARVPSIFGVRSASRMKFLGGVLLVSFAVPHPQYGPHGEHCDLHPLSLCALAGMPTSSPQELPDNIFAENQESSQMECVQHVHSDGAHRDSDGFFKKGTTVVTQCFPRHPPKTHPLREVSIT